MSFISQHKNTVNSTSHGVFLNKPVAISNSLSSQNKHAIDTHKSPTTSDK